MEVKLPVLGEGIEKATVSFWFVKEGDEVKLGQDLVELATEKAAFNLPSPSAGRLTKIIAAEGATVKTGDTLASLAPTP